MSMRKILTIFLLGVFVVACESYNLQKYKRVDLSVKTMNVPAGGHRLKGKIKKALVDAGWKLYVYQGPEVIKGEIGSVVKVLKYDTFASKYTLLMSYSHAPSCWTGPRYGFDFSLIDNKSGDEVFTLSGNECESDILKMFMEALEGNSMPN